MNESNGGKVDSGMTRRLSEVTDVSSLPRERAEKFGIGVLSDAEVMAILLGTGTKGKNVMDLANEILRVHDGHLSELSRKSVNDLCKSFSGIGRSKALALIAALELGRRAAQDAAEIQAARKSVTGSADCYELMRNKIQDLDHEEFWVMLLNNSLKRISEVKISEGATNFTVVEIKKIIRHMIDKDANNVVLFHNHPSGALKPSPQDDALTRKICEAAKIFDFKVVDHLIITSSGYFSYADEGRL